MTYDNRWAEMLGYELEELTNNLDTFKSLSHPEDRDRVLALLVSHLKGESESYEAEHRMRHKQGHWVWVHDQGRITERNRNGTPLRACGTHLDITARKQLEMEREMSLKSMEESNKVLRGLTGVAGVIATSKKLRPLLKKAATLMPESWTYPEVARCRIALDGHIYESEPFETTAWRLSAPIIINDVCVVRWTSATWSSGPRWTKAPSSPRSGSSSTESPPC